MILLCAAAVGFIFGFVCHNIIVAEDLKIAATVKALVSAKIAAAKVVEKAVEVKAAAVEATAKAEEKKI